MALDPSGRFAYVANYFNGAGGNSVWQYTVAADGKLSPMTSPRIAAGSSPTAIATVGSWQ